MVVRIYTSHAITSGKAMSQAVASIIDVGGESTRPGAEAITSTRN